LKSGAPISLATGFQIIEPDAASQSAEKSDLSFAQDPFATTQAVTALVLWSANIVYSRVG